MLGFVCYEQFGEVRLSRYYEILLGHGVGCPSRIESPWFIGSMYVCWFACQVHQGEARRWNLEATIELGLELIPRHPQSLEEKLHGLGQKHSTPEGRKWYNSHTEAKYFSDVVLEDENLDRDFPNTSRQCCGGILYKLEDRCPFSLCYSEGRGSSFDPNNDEPTFRDHWCPFWCSHGDEHQSLILRDLAYSLWGSIHSSIDSTWTSWLSSVLLLCPNE